MCEDWLISKAFEPTEVRRSGFQHHSPKVRTQVLPQLSEHLLGVWDDLPIERRRPNRLSFLGIGGSIQGGKANFLIFADEDRRPVLLAKILRNPNKINQIQREESTLLRLQNLPSDFIHNSIPKPILYENIEGRWVILESILEGTMLLITMGSGNLPEKKNTILNFGTAIKWLTKFHKETTCLIPSTMQKEFRDSAQNSINQFCSAFPLLNEEKAYLLETQKGVEELEDKDAPLFFKHGDFCRQNILSSEIGVGVIDWEFSQDAGLPLHDLFFFFTTYYFQAMRNSNRADYLRNFELSFFEKNWYSNLIRRYLMGYCSELNINMAFAKLFFILFLINSANQELDLINAAINRGYAPLLIEPEGEITHSYADLTKDQLYINLFRILVRKTNRLTICDYPSGVEKEKAS